MTPRKRQAQIQARPGEKLLGPGIVILIGILLYPGVLILHHREFQFASNSVKIRANLDMMNTYNTAASGNTRYGSGVVHFSHSVCEFSYQAPDGNTYQTTQLCKSLSGPSLKSVYLYLDPQEPEKARLARPLTPRELKVLFFAPLGLLVAVILGLVFFRYEVVSFLEHLKKSLRPRVMTRHRSSKRR